MFTAMAINKLKQLFIRIIIQYVYAKSRKLGLPREKRLTGQIENKVAAGKSVDI